MDGKIVRRVIIKLCAKLGKSAIKTLEMLREVFGERYLSQTAVFEWHTHFKASRVSPEGDKRSRRPSTNSENLRTHP
jgi:hypothetical protein